MGSSSKTTNSNSTANSLTQGYQQTTLPNYATQSLQDYTNKVDQFGNIDPTTLVAGSDPLQTQAAASAGNLGSTWGTGLNSAVNGTTAVQNASTPQIGSTSLAAATGYAPTMATASNIDTKDIQRLMSPYLSDVVNATLNQYDQQAGQTTAAQQAAAAANGAFGGSRYGVAQALTQGQLAQGRATTQSTLLNQGYDTALQAAEQDAAAQNAAALANAGYANQASQFGAGATNTANLTNSGALNTTAGENLASQNTGLDRQLTAAGQQGSLASLADTLANQDINQQATQGATQRGIQSAYDTAGLSQLQALGQLLGMGQFGLQTGSATVNGGTQNASSTSTTTSDPGLLGTLSSLAGLGQGFGSAVTGALSGGTSLASLFAGPTTPAAYNFATGA